MLFRSREEEELARKVDEREERKERERRETEFGAYHDGELIETAEDEEVFYDNVQFDFEHVPEYDPELDFPDSPMNIASGTVGTQVDEITQEDYDDAEFGMFD